MFVKDEKNELKKRYGDDKIFPFSDSLDGCHSRNSAKVSVIKRSLNIHKYMIRENQLIKLVPCIKPFGCGSTGSWIRI